MISFVEYHKEYKINLLEHINNFSKVLVYKANKQNSTIFLCTGNTFQLRKQYYI